MKVTIHPSSIGGLVRAPASKSSMQRACAAALLNRGITLLENAGHSNDDLAALEMIKALGASVTRTNENIVIESNGVNPVADELNCGESGLGIRMFTPITAMSNRKMIIRGEGSLLNRPQKIFEDILPLLGVSIETNNGKLPLQVQGPLIPRDISLDGSLSSQFLTGLLMSYSASEREEVTIRVRNLKSKPYIDLTLEVMKSFGMDIPHMKNYEEFVFEKRISTDTRRNINYTVEGDWSNGAFLLVAGAIAGPVTIHGLDMQSTQGDKAIIEAMIRANASLAIEAKGIKIHPSKMKGFDFDANECPDLFPPLVALASYSDGKTRIEGAGRLIHKESNRAKSLKEEFGKLGVELDIENDTMIIRGGKRPHGADLNSHNDHRIVMACAIAALGASDSCVIDGAEAVNKSYPDFFWHLKKLGADISLINKKFIHE